MSILPRNNRQGGDGTFKPQLTSLVDVMTILLVFLIKSFSTEGQIVTQAKDLQLPISTSEKPPRPRCAVEITRKAVLADGQVIETLDKIAGSDSLLVPPLFSWMKLERAKCTDLLKPPEVMIQCDREVEFAIVKKVMFTCSKAGFIDFSVLVLQEE
ncbi:MAG: biopolymer transporter ExbD [Chitinispirillaceae bacterium]|nr:biopolymer transporter ExbD [Chitinispirillaceae bacterium]